MNHRDNLKKRAVASKSESLHNAYRMQRNRANRVIKNAKRKFYLESIDLNRGNPKEMWKNINLIIGRSGQCSKTTIISSIKQNNNANNKVTNEKDIAESLNKYFNEIGPGLSNKLGKTNTQFLDYIKPA